MFDWFTKEKRKTYRVKSGPEHQFGIAIIGPDKESYQCEPVDISINGAAGSPPKKCPKFQPGDRVELEISIFPSNNTVRVLADIKRIDSDEHSRILRFQFLDPDGIAEKLDNDDFRILNRRQHYRLEPVEPSHIRVTAGWEGHTADGWIIDISISGMGFGVTKKTAEEIGRPDRMQLRFSLPEVEGNIQLAGPVQFRKQIGNNYLYGIQFDLSLYGEVGRQEKAISAFILKQQQIILQRRYHARQQG